MREFSMKVIFSTFRVLCLMLGLYAAIHDLTLVGGLAASPGNAAAQAARPRRVNLPYFSGAIDINQAAIFWFGVNEWYQNIPSRNYVDVRIAYSPEGLYWRATGIDYYLWNKANAIPSDDLTRYDALAIYIDTGHDRAASPQTDDYYFLVGLHGDESGDTPQYRRQARGTGSGWDTSAISSAAWSDYSGWQWSDTGPNNNSGNIDYGWVMGGTIPWSAVGLSGPPPNGTVWGFGALQYDQDQSPGTPPLQENWPEGFNRNQPSTWGELRFGIPSYTPPSAVQRGSVLIRSATPLDNTVEDSWMGGGGWCNSGHEGHSEDNHGNDDKLFVGSEIQPTHFPCYNKSYLRFSLASMPANKVIISATLTLHHWGGANVDMNTTSYVWLSSVTDAWNEMTIHWNNAPLAQENFSMTPIPPKRTPLVWPGDPYRWNVSQAVAEAYAAGQPVSFAIYDSTTGRDSSKYLTSSENGINDDPAYWNWNIAGRPRLDITYGDPVASLIKRASPILATRGSTITYTLNLVGSGQTLSLTDTIPSALSNPVTMNATFGTPQYNSSTRQLTWSAAPTAGQAVTITYTVTANVSGPLMVSNTATLTAPGNPASNSTAFVCIDCRAVWLPLITR
jgi:hypothetical protein